MPIAFTEQQLAFQDMARRFAQREVEPVANRIDAEERTPDEMHYPIIANQLFHGRPTLVPPSMG